MELKIKVGGREIVAILRPRSINELTEFAEKIAEYREELDEAGLLNIRPATGASNRYVSEMAAYEVHCVPGCDRDAIKDVLKETSASGSFFLFIEEGKAVDWCQNGGPNATVVRPAALRVADEAVAEAYRRERMEAVLASATGKDEAIKIDCLDYARAVEGSL